MEPVGVGLQAAADAMNHFKNDDVGDVGALSQDEKTTILEFVENLDCVTKRILDGPLDVDLNEMRIHGLSGQADILESTFHYSGPTECIEKAVECRSQALILTPVGHARRPYTLATLGSALKGKFERLGDVEDINKAIQLQDQAMQLTPEWHPNWLARSNNLGNSYLCRFQCLGELSDIDKAIEYQSQAVLVTPDGHSDKPRGLSNLGGSYGRRFERLDELPDISKAIEALRQAVMLTPDGHEDKPGFLSNLGNSYQSRFERHGEVEDIDRAIKCRRRAVLLTHDGHPDKPRYLSNLGGSYARRFERLGELAEIEKAIESLRQAVQLTPDGHADKPVMHSNLGAAYLCRFGRLGELSDIDKAIESQRQAVLLTADGHANIPRELSNLGGSYLRRFEHIGELADIDKAIESLSQAVLLTPDGHANIPGQLSNLGGSYLCRFERLGERPDIDKAIESQRQAVLLTPDGHADKPSHFNNLGNSYLSRFEQFGERPDIDRAIQSLSYAVLLTPDGHAVKPSRLNNLGSSYLSRFEHFGERPDIDRAIECLSHAVLLTPDGHSNRPAYFNNLGNSYQSRFECYGELEDIDKAIESLRQAVLLTPDGHALKPGRLSNLGNPYQLRFRRLGQLSDLESAQSCFQSGAQSHVFNPETQIKCARKWAKTSSQLGLSPQPAYERCMELVPQVIWLGSTIGQRYVKISSISDLATEAVAWAISAQLYDLAIEWLEQGRSIVWNQILQLRTPFDDISAVDPAMGLSLKHLASQLEASSSRQASSNKLTDSLANLENDAQHHRRLAAEWESQIERVRSMPGFENFMKPRKAIDLKLAAKDGPIVLINTHPTRWDALVIFPGCDDIAHIPLFILPPNENATPPDHLNRESLPQQRSERVGGLGRVNARQKSKEPFKNGLVALWHVVVQPILNALACTRKLPIDELPQVTWCATGPLAFLPLHAAGPYDGSSPNAFDLVISSYTPSLNASWVSSSPVSQPSAGILAVGQKYTEGLPPLPNTVPELAAIKQHAEAVRFLQLDEQNASTDAVLNAMDNHSWVHLACHATQNAINPAHSAFHLHDGNLTLEAITKRQFKNKGLAFLSACQTAKGDGSIPDEAVHLAAGMLMAGYPSVIATMWSIADADGPIVAQRVYAELLKDGKMDHTQAARALHKAVAELREKIGVKEFKRWVPFIHIGV